MDATYPETPTSDRSKAIDQLLKGRDVANRLKRTFDTHTHVMDDQSSMLNQILNSFSNCLALLSKVSDDPDEVSQFSANTHCWDACQKSEDSGESIKSTAALKERRGCYKRRKIAHSWSRDTSDLVDDGYQWRKYGQKTILNAKFPRNYYRCTHKHDQLCQATKQVQRISEDPPVYRTTYCGHHTCKNSQFVITHHSSDSSNLICFTTTTTATTAATNNPPCKQESNPLFQSCFPTVKQESSSKNNETNHLDGLISHNNQSLSSEHLLSYELWHGFDHGDVISSTTSASTHNSLDDISFMVECGEFDDDVLQYEFS